MWHGSKKDKEENGWSYLATLVLADGVLKAKLEWDVLFGNTPQNSETDL